MKKNLFIFYLLVLFTFVNCSDTGDEPSSLPFTDTSVFFQENSICFPEGTQALEVYSTLFQKYGLGEKSVSGIWQHTESTTLNGKTFSDTTQKNINKINIYKVEKEISHQFCVTIYFDDETNLQLYYEWQYKNTNAWNNNKTTGEITISF